MTAVQPLSLAKQSGLVVLELLHQSCLQLESNYMKSWLPNLSNKHLQEEEQLDCRNLDLETIVKNYETKLKKRKKRVVKRVEGIPVGQNATEYITYRKCHYLYTVHKWRESLVSAVTPMMVTDLMELAISLYRHSRDRMETGAVTLQSVLTCEWTHRLLTLTTEYRNQYRRATGHQANEEADHRLAPTLILSSLQSASRLAHLSLERLATDEMMLVLSNSVRNLTHLNINESKVTDRGLLSLCGLVLASDRDGARVRLSRRCKTEVGLEDSLGNVKNWLPRWVKLDNSGCDKLQHLEALEINLTWNLPGWKESATVPMDAGFVGVLDTLPLKSLDTEVGGRAVLAWHKWKKRVREADRRLEELIILSESRPTPAMVTSVGLLCPQLMEFRVDWPCAISGMSVSREDWVVSLPSMIKLTSLVTSDIDHKTDNLTSLIPTIGANLTKLQLQEMWSINTSLIKAIKENCVSLTRLVLLMSVKDHLGTMMQIHIERDAELTCQETMSSRGMQKLTDVHIMGPFRAVFTRYLLDSSPNIENLTLSVDFPDPAFCNVIPDPRKDYIGLEYMKEVMKGNNLSKVKEMHLMTQYSRGKKNLDKDFALFLLKTFPNLVHLGHFKLWSLTPKQKREIKSHLVANNMNIMLDLDQRPRPSDNAGDLRNIYVEDADTGVGSCHWLPIKPMSTLSFFAEIADMLAGPDILWPPGFMVEDFEDNNPAAGDGDNDANEDAMVDVLGSDSDSSDDDDDHQDQDIGQMLPPVGLEPVCVIQ